MKTPEYSALEQMIASANKESDRGCALILSANLDTRLGGLISDLCVTLPSNIEKRLFSGTGALATFSSRIDMCYALGQLGEKEYRDLHLIRKIRNEFAHHEDGLTFESSSVKARCFELGLVKEMEADYPSQQFQVPQARNRFQILVFSLCLIILHCSKIALEKRPSVPSSRSILPNREVS